MMDDGSYNRMYRGDDWCGDEHRVSGMQLSDTLMRDGRWWDKDGSQNAGPCGSEAQQRGEYHELWKVWGITFLFSNYCN